MLRISQQHGVCTMSSWWTGFYGIRTLLRVGNSATPNFLPDPRDWLPTGMLETLWQAARRPKISDASHMKCLVSTHMSTKMGHDTEPRTSCTINQPSTKSSPQSHTSCILTTGSMQSSWKPVLLSSQFLCDNSGAVTQQFGFQLPPHNMSLRCWDLPQVHRSCP